MPPPPFTTYQRLMWTSLSYLTVCRFYIDLDKHGNYTIKETGRIRRLFYYTLWINSITKIIYLILTYNGLLLEVHFLDQMSMWDWFLCFSQLVQETNIWYRKYPLYEVLLANWKVQEEVFGRLGRPEGVNRRITGGCSGLVYLHCTIVFIGCGAILTQFLSAPKYALNTFAIFPYDHWALRALFGIHEYFYIFHIWVHQAGSIVLCEVFSITYTHIINEMTQVMKTLSTIGRIKPKGKENKKLYIPDRIINTKSIAPGTDYDINTLLKDYKKIMLATTEFNVWVGKRMAGTNMSNYGQFISDVFMMIQLLKEADTDLTGVAFFAEDACAGMCILFRMLILMSRVYPASEEFLEAFKTYLHHESGQRGYFLRYERTLRVVAAKIGGYSTNGSTVPKGVNALVNYYIMAAMWQRPEGRRT